MQKFDMLIALYIACILIAEVMGAKTFPLIKIFNFQLTASVAIFTLPLVFTINDVITEVYGKERTRSVIRAGLTVIVFLLLFSFLATSLPPSVRFKTTEPAYDTVFGLSIRMSAASIVAFALAEFLDVAIFTRLRRKLGKKSLWLRNNLSNFISQFFDTTIFMFLAFYVFEKPFSDNVLFLSGLILPYWLIKCFVSVIETPLVYLGVRWLKETPKE